MDLRNRTIPEKPTDTREPSAESECGDLPQQQNVDARSSPTLLLDDDGFTAPFDMDITTTLRGAPQQSGAREKETPTVRWPAPPMMQGEPTRDFETAMRGFMEAERYAPSSGNSRECPQERGTTPVNVPASRPTERPQFVTPIVRDERERLAHSDYGHGAVGGSNPHESTLRPGGSYSRPGDHVDDVRGPALTTRDFYLLDHVPEAELLRIDHQVIITSHRCQEYLSFCSIINLVHIFQHFLGDTMNGKLFGLSSS